MSDNILKRDGKTFKLSSTTSKWVYITSYKFNNVLTDVFMETKLNVYSHTKVIINTDNATTKEKHTKLLIRDNKYWEVIPLRKIPGVPSNKVKYKEIKFKDLIANIAFKHFTLNTKGGKR